MKKHCYLLTALCLFLFTQCDEEDSYPFENETVLDCRNLKIRKVTIAEDSWMFPGQKVFRLTMENTCKLCEGFMVYNQFFMIDKNTNDTIASQDCYCLQPPENKHSEDYDLKALVATMPNLDNIKFVFQGTCSDVEYAPE